MPHSRAHTPARILAMLSIALLALQIASGVSAVTGRREPFNWGANLRLRQEYLANVYDFSEAAADDHNYLRVRSQLWGSWTPSDRWKIYAMLTNEHRHWFKSNKGLEDAKFEMHELIVENLYIEGKGIGGTPFGFVIGRQNLFYGEGFVCWDGGPLDGSRTAYFNALRLTASFDKRRFEIHFISDPETDEYITPLNDQEQKLIEWDEMGAGLYYIDESIDGKLIEAYYFYKSERDEDEVYPDSDIHTIGARASGRVAKNLSFAAEAAAQFGDYCAADRLAYAGYATLKRSFRPFALSAGGIYLSGDDPSPDRYERWDPIYSRWPKWSDLYIYTLGTERGPAYWENIAALWFGTDLTPVARFVLELRLRFLWAPEERWTTLETSDAFAYRGTMSIVKLNWTINDRLTGHFLWEAFQPGDYYARGEDTAHFLRWELLAKY